jgi:hypothetical protein
MHCRSRGWLGRTPLHAVVQPCDRCEYNVGTRAQHHNSSCQHENDGQQLPAPEGPLLARKGEETVASTKSAAARKTGRNKDTHRQGKGGCPGRLSMQQGRARG